VPQYAPTSRILTILVAEDDPNDLKLLSLAAANENVPAKFLTVRDGEEVVEYLASTFSQTGRNIHFQTCWF
jgi:CheY-like chemotaxis protein